MSVSTSGTRDCKFYIYDGSYVSIFNELPGARDANGMPSIWYSHYLEMVNTVAYQLPSMEPNEHTHTLAEAASAAHAAISMLTLVPKHNYVPKPDLIMKPRYRRVSHTHPTMAKLNGLSGVSSASYVSDGLRGGAGYMVGIQIVIGGTKRRDLKVAMVWAHNAIKIDLDDVYFYVSFMTSRNVTDLARLMSQPGILSPTGTMSFRGYDTETDQAAHPSVIGKGIYPAIFKHLGIDSSAELPPMSRELFNLVKTIVNTHRTPGFNPFEKYYGNNFRERLEE